MGWQVWPCVRLARAVRPILKCSLSGCCAVRSLKPSFFRIAVIPSVGDYQVVSQIKAHHLARLLESLRYAVVVAARTSVAARVVVAQGDDGGVAQQRVFYYHAYVDGRFGYSAVRQLQWLYQLVVLVHQQYPRLFLAQVLHARVHVFVYCHGRVELFALLGFLRLSPFAQFAGSKYGHGLGRPMPL